jgi:hypothetical protein
VPGSRNSRDPEARYGGLASVILDTVTDGASVLRSWQPFVSLRFLACSDSIFESVSWAEVLEGQ